MLKFRIRRELGFAFLRAGCGNRGLACVKTGERL